jgi:hypothetical protein
VRSWARRQAQRRDVVRVAERDRGADDASSTPSVDALVSACMRARTSPKRTTPTPDSSVSNAPASTSTSPVIGRAPR